MITPVRAFFALVPHGGRVTFTKNSDDVHSDKSGCKCLMETVNILLLMLNPLFVNWSAECRLLRPLLTRKKNVLTQVDIGIAIGISTTHRVGDVGTENIDCIESDCVI